MSISPATLAFLYNVSAGAAPLGVESNFINPPSQVPATTALLAVFVPPMLLFVVIRFYVRVHVQHSSGWDDYFCGLGTLGSLVYSVVTINSFRLGYGRHMWDIRASTVIDTRNTMQLSCTMIIYPLMVLFVKISILTLYLRLFAVDNKQRWGAYFGIAFNIFFYIGFWAVQVATFIECISTLNTVGNHLCSTIPQVVVMQAAVNVATDLYILFLPIPQLLALRLPKTKKFGILCIFLTGAVTCLAAIARLVIIAKTLKLSDALWNSAIATELSIVEINVAIVAACMPSLPTFAAHSGIFNWNKKTLLFREASRSTSRYATNYDASHSQSQKSQSQKSPYIPNFLQSNTKNASVNGEGGGDEVPLARIYDGSWLVSKDRSGNRSAEQVEKVERAHVRMPSPTSFNAFAPERGVIRTEIYATGSPPKKGYINHSRPL